MEKNWKLPKKNDEKKQREKKTISGSNRHWLFKQTRKEK